MLLNAFIHIQQAMYCRIYDLISASPLYGYTMFGVTHTRTFEDSVYPNKYIGVFTKRRPAVTNFRRA